MFNKLSSIFSRDNGINLSIAITVFILIAIVIGFVFFKLTRNTEENRPNTENPAVDVKEIEDSPFGAHGYIKDEEDYRLLSEMGIKWIRFAGFNGLNFNGGNYDFSNFEQSLNEAASNNLQTLATIKAGVNIKSSGVCTDTYPENIEDYTIFLREIISKYGNEVKYYQIGNEPEGKNFWCDTPENYANLLRISYVEIKNICPDCQIVIGGATSRTSYSNTSFYETVFDNLKKYPECDKDGCHDIFDLHMASCDICAGDPIIPCDTKNCSLSYIEDTFNNIVELQDKFGFKKPIWSTEFGFLKGNLKNTSLSLPKSYVFALSLGFEKIFWRVSEECCQIKSGRDLTDAYYSYKNLIEKIGGYSKISRIKDNEYRFEFSNKNPIYVFWSDSSVNIPEDIQNIKTITDYLGSSINFRNKKSLISEELIFIETN